MSLDDLALHTTNKHSNARLYQKPHGAVAERASSGGASRAPPGAGLAAVTLRASQAASRQKSTCENAARGQAARAQRHAHRGRARPARQRRRLVARLRSIG